MGVDEETETLGSVTFEVFAGSTQLGTTVARDGTQGTAPIDLDVTGRSEIRLVVGSGADNNIDFDHADWADAKLLCDTTPPTVTSVVPGTGATGVAVDANVVATFSEPMDSVDGLHRDVHAPVGQPRAAA